MDGVGRDIRIGIVGAGAMGRGIAQVAVTCGMSVRINDTRPGAAAEAAAFAAGMIRRQVEKGRLATDEAERALGRLECAEALTDLAESDLVVEAIVEDLAAKQSLFRALEACLSADAILASNTSSLSITEIAAACNRPERVAGLHFFNPVPLMNLVEVIPGLRTAPATVERLSSIAAAMGKTVVRVSDTPGFLVNHIGRGYVTEALRILTEGIATPAEIDAIMKAAGFLMGPFELLDLTGLDVSQPVMEGIYHQYFEEPMYRPSVIGRRRLAAGLLGRKSGEGFYSYAKAPGAPSEPALETAAATPIWIDPADGAHASALRAALSAAGAQIETGEAPSAQATIVIAPSGSDATTSAVERRLDPRRVVAVDTFLGADRPTTLMRTPLGEPGRVQFLAELFAASGTPVAAVKDSPGFVAPRILSMIVNVACGIAQQRIAAPPDIDLGARLGLAYPVGPLAWGDAIGPDRVLSILDALHAFYRDPRYRPSPWLKRRAMLGVSLLTPD